MNQDDLDRVLNHKDEILPSSGFAASVMAAVKAEASAPPPIPFPWKRALPGLLACVFALVWLAVAGVALVTQGYGAVLLDFPVALAPIWWAASWGFAGLLVTLACVVFSLRLVSHQT